VATWLDLVADRPDVAEGGKALLYQHGVGLAFLATVGRMGRPRVHPICPLLDGTGLYAFIVDSPKQDDLLRDGMYALHSFPCPDNEDAFYLRGHAEAVEDSSLREMLAVQFVAERVRFNVPAPTERDVLFELEFDTCMFTRTKGHGDPAPEHVIWHPIL
jgi:hypothetical protein